MVEKLTKEQLARKRLLHFIFGAAFIIFAIVFAVGRESRRGRLQDEGNHVAANIVSNQFFDNFPNTEISFTTEDGQEIEALVSPLIGAFSSEDSVYIFYCPEYPHDVLIDGRDILGIIVYLVFGFFSLWIVGWGVFLATYKV